MAEAGRLRRLSWRAKDGVVAARRRVLSVLSRLLPRSRRAGAAILAYHTASDGEVAAYPGNVLTEGAFRRQMRRIAAAGHPVLSLDDVVAALESGRELPRGAVVLTFDDGYRACLDTVAPILEEHGFPATFFVIAGLLDEGGVKWDDLLWLTAKPFDKRIVRAPPDEVEAALRAAELADPEAFARWRRRCRESLMSVADLRELLRRGFSVQSHSLRHYYPSALSAEDQEREIRRSKERLEEALSTEVRHYAYPIGVPSSFGAESRRLTELVGYRSASAVAPRYVRAGVDRFALPRFGIGRATTAWELDLILSGRYR